MLVETGRIVAVETDSLWVETIRQSTCGSCTARKGCGHSLINRVSDGSRSYIRVLPGRHDLRDCRLNDEVTISIPESVLLRSSAVVYLLPLLGMLAGALGAVTLGEAENDLLAALGAVGGFILGMGVVRWHAWLHRSDDTFQPTLVEICRSRGASLPVG